MGGQVTSYEIDPTLGAQAAAALDTLAQENPAELIIGDIFQAEIAEASFDVIAVTGAIPISAERFIPWLTPGGRLYSIEGEPPMMHATLRTRQATHGVQTIILDETLVTSLQQAPQPEPFIF